MSQKFKAAAVFSILFSLSTLHAEAKSPADDRRFFYLVSNGFHTSLAVRTADFPRESAAIVRDFPRAKYLVIGWGSDDFYRAKKVTPSIFCKTVLLPTRGALHVIPISREPEKWFSHSDIVRIETSKDGIARLCKFVGGTFRTDPRGKPIPIGGGYYKESKFYTARGHFFLANSCNVWVARGMHTAGCRITPPLAWSAGDLMWRAKKHGVKLQSRRKPLDPL